MGHLFICQQNEITLENSFVFVALFQPASGANILSNRFLGRAFVGTATVSEGK